MGIPTIPVRSHSAASHVALLLAACCFLVTAQTKSPTKTARGVLYSSAGAELSRYEIDADAAALTKKESITLPAAVQYAWPHPSHKYLYISWSNGGAASASPGATAVPRGDRHGVNAYRIERDGALTLIGKPVMLPARPIHNSVDASGTHLLLAYNEPSNLTIHKINTDGTIGAVVPQTAKIDAGIYAHQIRTDASGKTLILVARGNGPGKNRPEDRGALKVFHYADGILGDEASIAPNGGENFQPRHLDFHPTRPWVYVSLERQSKLQLYKLENGVLNANPLFTKDSITDSSRRPQRQNAGTIHVHPNGKFLYQANRSAVPDGKGKTIDGGGENTIAVYSLDAKTGEPTRIQNIETHGAEPRTFALDPSARLLVAGNQTALLSSNSTSVPASLAVYRVKADGKLDYVRKYDVDTSKGNQFWTGIVELPQ
ncbi:MAG: beta-propeller fold lactonase family protein [Bryobacteraceae bacterium]